jgi:hypothetical protein
MGLQSARTFGGRACRYREPEAHRPGGRAVPYAVYRRRGSTRHELGPCLLDPPDPLAGTSTRHPARTRRKRPGHRRNLLRIRGGGHLEQQRARDPAEPSLLPCTRATTPSSTALSRQAGTIAGLQPRRRANLDQVRQQPGPQPEHLWLPRPEGPFVRQPVRSGLLGDGRRGHHGIRTFHGGQGLSHFLAKGDRQRTWDFMQHPIRTDA